MFFVGNTAFSLGFAFHYYLFPFITLVLVVSLLIMGYTKYYMSSELNLYSYMNFMLLFMGSMCLLLVSLTFLTLLLSWEMLGTSSFFLIFYYNSWESQMNSMVTIMTMRMGEFFLFLSFSLVFMMNLMNFSLCYYVSLSYVFFIMFSLTKSAQFPFSSWLPKAMSAPTPTSSLVHSSTLVTAGLIVVFSLSEMALVKLLMTVLVMVGAITLFLGSGLALFESSVKKVVAYSTLSQMGLATMVFGLGNFHVGLLNLVSHGLAKSLLFMQVGYMMHIMCLQQNTRLWNGSSHVETFMKVQIITSLFSLCGTMFMGGMMTKESLLEFMLSNSVLLFLLFLLMSCIYLTFLYSVLLYKTLFNNSGGPVFFFKGSVMMLFTYLEVFLVVGFTTWMMMNIVTTMGFIVGVSSLIPVIILLTLIVCFSFFISQMFNYYYMNLMLNLLSSLMMNKWLTYFMPLKVVEAVLNMLNLMIFMVILLTSQKMSISLSFNHVIIFMVIMLLIM